MAGHLSDEEQLQNLKRWFKESGLSTLIVIALCVGGYFGWELWKEQRQVNMETASILYQQMMEVVIVEPGQKANDTQHRLANDLATQLKEQFSGTQYARYGALLMAKLAVEKNDLNTAVDQLTWALTGADEGLTLIINLRLARVEAARANIDLALSMLNNRDAKTMSAAYAEARGDFLLMKNDRAGAYKAYQQAIALASEQDVRITPVLELKLNQVMPVEQTDESVSPAVDA